MEYVGTESTEKRNDGATSRVVGTLWGFYGVVVRALGFVRRLWGLLFLSGAFLALELSSLGWVTFGISDFLIHFEEGCILFDYVLINIFLLSKKRIKIEKDSLLDTISLI